MICLNKNNLIFSLFDLFKFNKKLIFLQVFSRLIEDKKLIFYKTINMLNYLYQLAV